MDQVIDRVLEMDKRSSLMSMGALHRGLPKEEDLRFLQALQCTMCLNSGHSTVDCTMRMQCMICHSRGHTTDRCKYNLLNRQAALVWHIEPRHGQEPKERFRREDHYRPERRDRYNERRRDDYKHDRDDRHREGYNRDRYERDYSPDYDRRRDDRRYLNRQGNRNFRRNQRRGYFCREERWKVAKEYNQGPSTNTTVTPPELRKTEENRRKLGRQQKQLW